MTDKPQKQPTKPRKFSQLRIKAQIKKPPHYGAGLCCANFDEFTVQIGDNLRYCRFAFNI